MSAALARVAGVGLVLIEPCQGPRLDLVGVRARLPRGRHGERIGRLPLRPRTLRDTSARIATRRQGRSTTAPRHERESLGSLVLPHFQVAGDAVDALLALGQPLAAPRPVRRSSACSPSISFE